MLKICLSGLISFFLFVPCVIGQTTLEEYNYVTKGYKIQIESGLDMKSGYEFRDIDSWGLSYSDFQRKATFKQLFRTGERIPCATLMILSRTDNEYREFLCIPHYDSTDEIWQKAFDGFRAATQDWSEASRGYVWGMVKMISYLSSER